jgi:hypothetical protein
MIDEINEKEKLFQKQISQTNTGGFVIEDSTSPGGEITWEQQQEISTPRRRERSLSRLFRSRSRTARDTYQEDQEAHEEQRPQGASTPNRKPGDAPAPVANQMELRQEDIKDVQSALKEMEKQLNVAKRRGRTLSRATVRDALLSVVDSLEQDSLEHQNVAVQEEETNSIIELPAEPQSLVERTAEAHSSRFTRVSVTTEEYSPYTHGFTTTGNDRAGYDFTTVSNDREEYDDGLDCTSSESEYTGVDVTDDDGTDDGTPDDRTYDGSIGASTYATEDEVGLNAATSFGDEVGRMFPSWNTKSQTSGVKIEEEETAAQTTIFSAIAQAASFGSVPDDAASFTRGNSLDSNQSYVFKQAQKEAPTLSKSRAPSDTFAADKFRTLSVVSSPPPARSPKRSSKRSPARPPARSGCNAVEIPSWMGIDGDEMNTVLDDLLWRSPRRKQDGKTARRSETPKVFYDTPKAFHEIPKVRSQDSIDDLVKMRQRSSAWDKDVPTEASTPSGGNSSADLWGNSSADLSPSRNFRQPESSEGHSSADLSPSRNFRRPGTWFRRGKKKDHTPLPAKIVVCDPADPSANISFPFGYEEDEERETKPPTLDCFAAKRRSPRRLSQRYEEDERRETKPPTLDCFAAKRRSPRRSPRRSSQRYEEDERRETKPPALDCFGARRRSSQHY